MSGKSIQRGNSTIKSHIEYLAFLRNDRITANYTISWYSWQNPWHNLICKLQAGTPYLRNESQEVTELPQNLAALNGRIDEWPLVGQFY